MTPFSRLEGVVDLIYNPEKTALLLEAEHLGIPNINGLYMLCAQGIKAYEIFTGQKTESELIAQTADYIRSITENIILVGMAGCGKTTVGQIVAEITGKQFEDADEAFAETYGKSPAQVIEAEGENEFRNMETEVLKALCKESGRVIATGGGAVTRERNRDIMVQNGRVVYIKRELSKLETKGRPLSGKYGVEALFEQRREAYESFADITVENEKTPTETAETIVRALKGE